MNTKYYNFYKEIIEILEENNNKIHKNPNNLNLNEQILSLEEENIIPD